MAVAIGLCAACLGIGCAGGFDVPLLAAASMAAALLVQVAYAEAQARAVGLHRSELIAGLLKDHSSASHSEADAGAEKPASEVVLGYRDAPVVQDTAKSVRMQEARQGRGWRAPRWLVVLCLLIGGALVLKELGGMLGGEATASCPDVCERQRSQCESGCEVTRQLAGNQGAGSSPCAGRCAADLHACLERCGSASMRPSAGYQPDAGPNE